MGLPKDLVSQEPGLGEWCILRGYRGSIAHGCYIPYSDPNSIDDKDVMAVCVPPLEYYFGLKGYGSRGRGTKEVKRDEWDIVIYEARKFIRLLQKGNPNVLMLLWLESNYYMKVTSAGQLLLDNRDLFVARHVYRSFTGYAYSQLHRMTHNACQGHMGAKRRTLIEKYGYDTKNASHLIRLLRMGIEFLRDGQLYVQRYDAAQLLEIKRGEWSLVHVQNEADRLFKLAEEVYLSCDLPEKPDHEKINVLATDVVVTAMTIDRV